MTSIRVQCILLGLVALAASAAAEAGERPVQYQGKSLRDWILSAHGGGEAYDKAWQAVRAIGARAEPAVPELLELLKHDDAYVCGIARAALELVPTRAIALVAPRLKSADAEVRLNAARTIAVLGRAGKDAAPALRPLLKDTEPKVRHKAAAALVALECEDAAVIELLIVELAHKQLNVDAIKVLGKCGSSARAAVPRLLSLMSSPQKAVRLGAISALGDIGLGAEPAIAPLVASLKGKGAGQEFNDLAGFPTYDVREDRRFLIIMALGGIGPAARGELLRLAEEPNHYPLQWVIASLAHVDGGSKALRNILVRGLASAIPEVREQAAFTLWDIGGPTPAAAPALLRLVNDKNEKMRTSALLALGEVARETSGVGAVLRTAVKERAQPMRQHMVRALGALRPVEPETIAALIDALPDPDEFVAVAAIHALGDLGVGARSAVEPLRRFQESAKEPLRQIAAVALWRITGQAEPTLSQLRQRLQTANPSERSRAAQQLLVFGRPAVPALRKALTDADHRVRVDAAEALWTIAGRDRALVDVLRQALARPQQYERIRALGAVGRLGPQARSLLPAVRAAALDRDGFTRSRAFRILQAFEEAERK